MGWLQTQINKQQKEDLKQFRLAEKRKAALEKRQKKAEALRAQTKLNLARKRLQKSRDRSRFLGILKKKRQNKVLSRKSRIRII